MGGEERRRDICDEPEEKAGLLVVIFGQILFFFCFNFVAFSQGYIFRRKIIILAQRKLKDCVYYNKNEVGAKQPKELRPLLQSFI